MAKKSVIQYYVAQDQLEFSGTILMTEQSKKEVVYTDFSTGTQLVLEGEGFKVKTGQIMAGTIDDVTILSAEGDKIFALRNIGIKAHDLTQDSADGMISQMFQLTIMRSNIVIGSKKDDLLVGGAGNDVIKGNGGRDEISGMEGKDILYGGAKSDFFTFAMGYGKDKIMDFDADGSDGSQDFLIADFMAIIDKKNVNGNTVLDFDNGDMLTLIGIKPNQIDESDFAN